MTWVPKIPNTPGLRWRLRNRSYEAIWRAPAAQVRKGFTPKNRLLWKGRTLPLTAIQEAELQDACQKLQDTMIMWSRGGFPAGAAAFNGSLASLVYAFQTDPDSTYHKRRYQSRTHSDQLLRLIVDEYGDTMLSDIKARVINGWHRARMGGEEGGKVASAQSFVGQLRTLFGFGFTLLEDKECERLCMVMNKLRFPAPKPRQESLTADQASLVRGEAHKAGFPSIALGQAMQFELMLRQKDCIGEWVPISEPGASDVTHPARYTKWLRGLRWNEIDENLILSHLTSKRAKVLTVNLTLYPMVMEELARLAGVAVTELKRSDLPASGPVIVCEYSKVPWVASEYRRKWRVLARAVGIPDKVFNMDSRSGAISEATGAGANLEHVRKAATHSSITMTQKYSRQDAEQIEEVQRARVAHRNKGGTE